MALQLDPTRPIYLQIMEEIKKRAVRGEYTPGAQLPSVRDMAKQIGVNPNTIARVYMELEREGFIYTRRGLGSYITEKQERVEKERHSIADDAAQRFMQEIKALELHNGHKKELIGMIKKYLFRDLR